MTEKLPEGFGEQMAASVQRRYAPQSSQNGPDIGVNSVAESKATAEVNAPTYVQFYRDDTAEQPTKLK